MLLSLLACRDPDVFVHAQVTSVETAVRVPASTFLWHSAGDACEGGWGDDAFLGVLDVAGDDVWFGGRPLGSLRAFADRNREALQRGQRIDDPAVLAIRAQHDAHEEWATRCGSALEGPVLLTADPATPADLLGPLVYAVGMEALLVADTTPDATVDRIPADNEHLVRVFIDAGSVTVSRGGPNLYSGADLPDLSALAPPRAGCAYLALWTGDLSALARTWDAVRAQEVRRVRIAMSLEAAKAPRAELVERAQQQELLHLKPTDFIAVLPLYRPPPWIYDGADRCGTNPSFVVPNIECECM